VSATISSIQIQAVKQHYGFSTSLLDVTINLEVFAFFATRNSSSDAIGVIYYFHIAHPYALNMLGSATFALETVVGREYQTAV
jgi:FRG domain